MHLLSDQCSRVQTYKVIKWHHFLLQRVPAERVRAAWRMFMYLSSTSWWRERLSVWWWRMDEGEMGVEALEGVLGLSRGPITGASLPLSISTIPESEDLWSFSSLSFSLVRLLLRVVFSCCRILILTEFALSCCSISQITSPVAVTHTNNWLWMTGKGGNHKKCNNFRGNAHVFNLLYSRLIEFFFQVTLVTLHVCALVQFKRVIYSRIGPHWFLYVF